LEPQELDLNVLVVRAPHDEPHGTGLLDEADSDLAWTRVESNQRACQLSKRVVHARIVATCLRRPSIRFWLAACLPVRLVVVTMMVLSV
jgi:hypothetical protein